MAIVGFFVALAILIIVLRALGAWMLRIDEVIKELKKINEKLNNNKE